MKIHGKASSWRKSPRPPSGDLLPWGSSFLNTLRLWHPRTWLGIIRLQARSQFSSFNLEALLEGLFATFLPIFCFWCIRFAGLSHGSSNRLMLASSLSPWTVSSLGRVVPELHSLASTCHRWAVIRKAPEDDAMDTLRTRVHQGRAYRTRRYDVYLPNEYQGRALLFLPGALVPHAAYSQVAAQLSDHGLVVVVVSLEPLRLATHDLGASSSDMLRIMKQVDRDYCKPKSLSSSSSSSSVPPTRWSLGGHSMGSFAAMHLTKALQPSHLVLWAIGASFQRSRANIASEACSVLIVQGSCDTLSNFTPEALRYFLDELPPRAVYKVISGGNHCGFATYSFNPIYDGIATISREKQHQLVTTMTAKFLLH